MLLFISCIIVLHVLNINTWKPKNEFYFIVYVTFILRYKAIKFISIWNCNLYVVTQIVTSIKDKSKVSYVLYRRSVFLLFYSTQKTCKLWGKILFVLHKEREAFFARNKFLPNWKLSYLFFKNNFSHPTIQNIKFFVTCIMTWSLCRCLLLRLN